ncbi:MAG: hypothetical protein ACFFCQ_00055 [Promethearchaeota archaeon]
MLESLFKAKIIWVEIEEKPNRGSLLLNQNEKIPLTEKYASFLSALFSILILTVIGLGIVVGVALYSKPTDLLEKIKEILAIASLIVCALGGLFISGCGEMSAAGRAFGSGNPALGRAITKGRSQYQIQSIFNGFYVLMAGILMIFVLILLNTFT